MAVNTWISTGSTDWNSAGNWSLGAAPVSTNEVRFISGSVSALTNLSQAAVDLASLYIGPGYTGQIGNSAASPLTISSASTVVEGGKAVYLANGNAQLDAVKVATPVPSTYVSLAGTITDLLLRKGYVSIESGTTTAAYFEPLGGLDANLAVVLAAPTLTTLHKLGGNTTMTGAGTVTTLRQSAGTFDVQAGTLTNAYLFGGTTWYKSATTVTLVHVYAGRFDASLDVQSKTITTVRKSPLATFRRNDSVTVTNGPYDLVGSILTDYVGAGGNE